MKTHRKQKNHPFFSGCGRNAATDRSSRRRGSSSSPLSRPRIAGGGGGGGGGNSEVLAGRGDWPWMASLGRKAI